MNRTAFIVDGFNLYHSLREAEALRPGTGGRWLDIRSLCASYLHLVGLRSVLGEIHYFSALATHLEVRDQSVTRRHRDFIRCLTDTGVSVELSRFKKKAIRCDHCGRRIVRHEEKETDVAMACRLIELLHEDRADTVVLVSGDTDLAPSVRLAKRLFQGKTTGFAFPFGRKNKELQQIADFSFQMSGSQYVRCQLPDPYTLRSGKQVPKPESW